MQFLGFLFCREDLFSQAAVANKLIKQAVAIAKSELPYDENYLSEKVCF
jgi:hypothetical protein